MTMKNFLAALTFALALAAPAPAAAADYVWPVVRVIEGDTVEVDASADLPPELSRLMVRLRGVDTPEKGHRARCLDERMAAHVAGTLVAVIDWGLDAQAAVELPHRCNQGGATELERGAALAALQDSLEARGHTIELRGMNSGLHTVQLDHNKDGEVVLFGAVDPRRDGLAAGR